jgi:hypothetical protein
MVVFFTLVLVFLFVFVSVIIVLMVSPPGTIKRNTDKWRARPDKTFMQQVREEYRERRKGK